MTNGLERGKEKGCETEKRWRDACAKREGRERADERVQKEERAEGDMKPKLPGLSCIPRKEIGDL